MRFRHLLAFAIAHLAERGIDQPRLEAEILVMEAAGVSRAWLYAHPDAPVDVIVWSDAETLIRQRGSGQPLAYVLGHKEFYGLDFAVDPRVLIPRPETEMLVDKAIEAIDRRLETRRQIVVADIGTGSGAIAVSVAVNVPETTVLAVDVSPEALEVAKANCQLHGVEDRVRLLRGDLLEPVPGPLDIILANLPYVKDSDLPLLQPEIRDYEPMIALRGGEVGLTAIHRLLDQAKQKVSPDGIIVLEIAWDQGRAAADLAKAAFPGAKIEVSKDLAALDRMVEIDLG